MSDSEGLPMDDSASAASSMEVTDRVASLEQRVQMQEDEIQLLKSALADVVRRLNLSEEQQSLGPRRGPTKARPMIATLPLRTTVNNGTVLPKKGSGTLPSPSGMGSRKDAPLSANRSTVRRANSNEHMGTLTRRDSGETKGNRTRAGSTGSNSSGKRSDSSRQREPIFNAGTRRVTHCKVTVQLYLSSSAKRTGSDRRSAGLKALAPPPAVSPPGPSLQAGGPSRTAGVRKTPSISLQLRKSRSLSQSAFRPLDTPSYRGPVRSPSHYFQICY